MIESGMSIARLNFSHGTHKEHLARIKKIRTLNKELGKNVKILADLEGYRIRVGKLRNGIFRAEKGKTVKLIFGKNEIKDNNSIPIDYSGGKTNLSECRYIYIDDGNICLEIVNVKNDLILTKVVVGGDIKNHKGINIPGFKFEMQGLTEKDKRDLAFAIKNKVDMVAQSFVRNRENVELIKYILKEKKYKCKVIAKIENEDGIKNIDEIISVSDGIMVARGDLGVSLPIYKVPIYQKMIINKCNDKNKMDITATQMLESMTEHLRPTRAEVTDVANAVIDGSDCVMLSGETACGKYPVEAVKMMKNIILEAEKYIKKVKK